MSNIELLQECKLQLEYLNEKFTPTGTTNALLTKIEAALQNKVSDVSPEIGENEYLDLTVLNEEDKAEFITKVAGSCAKELLKTFLGFGLNNLIEIMVTNDTDKKEYILTFQTKEQFEKRFIVNERKDSGKLNELDEILASFEDWMHGEDGKKITKARQLIKSMLLNYIIRNPNHNKKKNLKKNLKKEPTGI